MDLNHVGAHCFVQKRIQGTKHKNGVAIDDWYEASGLAGAPFFILERVLVVIRILGFRIRRPGRPVPICVSLIMNPM